MVGERIIFLKHEKNYAFIDGQNLIYNTKKNLKNPWQIDLRRFRVYLKEKHSIEVAYYFVGAYDEKHRKLYDDLKEFGFEVIFREHSVKSKSNKKGNVDTDIVFLAMKKIAEREKFDKILLTSDDGDYYRMVEYLISKNKFKKLLSPSSKNMSHLYKEKISDRYIDHLDRSEVKKKIMLK